MMTFAAASPGLLGIPVATLALAVSLLSFTVAMGALSWQIAKHWLDGGRPKVYLNAAVWEPNLKIMVNRSGGWGLDTGGLGTLGPENLELAQLVVENPGRTAITVYTPGLLIDGTDRPQQYTISPRSFELSGFGADSATGETSVRIDPYDRVTFLLDFWSIIPRVLREANGGNVKIRGCILVAGRSRPCKSSRRKVWNVSPDAWTFRKDLRVISPATVIWRELFKVNVNRDAGENDVERYPDYRLGAIVHRAMHRFPERPTADEFVTALREAGREYDDEAPFKYAQLAFSMDQHLDRHAGHLSAWSLTATPPTSE
ncbi:hypothetical protein ACF06O_29210 [Streptomyces albidoflavus]